jgi:hypothetical protein
MPFSLKVFSSIMNKKSLVSDLFAENQETALISEETTK